MGTAIRADELWMAWSRQQWKPHYLFAGPEDFLIEQATQQAIRHWLGDQPNPLNISRLDVESQSVAEILQAAQTVPFFGSQHMVCVSNVGKFSKADQTQLADSLDTLPPDCHLLFSWGADWRREDANSPLADRVSIHGQVVIFWTLYPEHAQRWLVEHARARYGKTLQPPAAAWLVLHRGEGLRLLDQELAKCCAYVGEHPEIGTEDVQQSFGYGKAGSPFEWVASIRQKKSAVSLRILNQLLSEGEEPIRLLALLTRSLRDWVSAKGSGEGAGMLAMRFHLRRGEEARFVQDLAQWSEDCLIDGVRLCVEAEQSIKTGKETPEIALTLLSFGLCRLDAVNAAR